MQQLGKRLHYIRKEKGISQEALAKKIGVSRGVIFNIEQNKSKPQEIVINSICNVLNINKLWLMTGQGEINSENKVLNELMEIVQGLSENEQMYLLDAAKLLKKHFQNQINE